MNQVLAAIFLFIIHAALGQKTARCIFFVNNSTGTPPSQRLGGSVDIRETQNGGTYSCSFNIRVIGFNPNDGVREHGFHVHNTADFSNGCQSTGGHYNPENKDHGAPSDDTRHVGDLGNIMENSSGAAIVTKVDSKATLSGPNSILNRAIVVHALTDDLGRGGNAESKRTGNAGARLACCRITEN